MYSQHDEDEWINKYMGSMPTGLYMDVGAGWFDHLSNTYMLYKKGWRGLAVEPWEGYHADWEKYRPRDILVKEAISDKPGLVSMASTIMNGSWLYAVHLTEGDATRMVQAITFAELLNVHPEFFNTDFLNLDVEMAEDKVLSTVDFTKFKPKWMIIEKVVRDQDNRKNWEHLFISHYKLVEENIGNVMYQRTD